MQGSGCAGGVRPAVHGIGVDSQTRCAHYRSRRDIVAIRMKCCGEYYACLHCHKALAGHPSESWPHRDWNRKAILCGSCGSELSICEYLASGSECPVCTAPFNPQCRHHHGFYFEAVS